MIDELLFERFMGMIQGIAMVKGWDVCLVEKGNPTSDLDWAIALIKQDGMEIDLCFVDGHLVVVYPRPEGAPEPVDHTVYVSSDADIPSLAASLVHAFEIYEALSDEVR